MSIELAQALLGLVTPNMEAVGVAAEPDHIVVYILASALTGFDRACIEEVDPELQVLLPGSVSISTKVDLGTDRTAWPGSACRRVFDRAGPDCGGEAVDLTPSTTASSAQPDEPRDRPSASPARSEDVELHRENDVLDLAVRALLGRITQNMVSIAISVTDEDVVLHVLLADEPSIDLTCIERAARELEGLLAGRARVRSVVERQRADTPWPGHRHRWVFHAANEDDVDLG